MYIYLYVCVPFHTWRNMRWWMMIPIGKFFFFFCEGYAASHQAIDDAILFPDGWYRSCPSKFACLAFPNWTWYFNVFQACATGGPRQTSKPLCQASFFNSGSTPPECIGFAGSLSLWGGLAHGIWSTGKLIVWATITSRAGISGAPINRGHRAP